MSTVRRHLRDDSGQMMAAMVIFVGITILAFLVVAVVPVGASTNERSRSQTAADSAALAGAEEVRTQWVTLVTAPVLLTMVSPLAIPRDGSTSAYSYARRNGSEVQVGGYRFDRRNSVYAQVRSSSSAYPENGFAEASATVEMDVDFSACRWSAPPEPPPPPAGTGPPVFERTLTCGAWSASYLITNVPGTWPTASYVSDTPKGLFDDLEPRIVD